MTALLPDSGPGGFGVPHPVWHKLADFVEQALSWGSAQGWLLLGVAVTALALVLAVRALWWWRQDRRAWRGATRVEILPGPKVDPAGAAAFWQHLLGLLRPRLLRWGTPHVVFEYGFDSGGLVVSVWVPGTVPAGQVAAAARSAWPGARTSVTRAAPPESMSGRVRGRGGSAAVSVGGRVRLARPTALPIATEHRLDPVRALIGAVGALRAGQTARVQILARPLSGARMAALTRTERTGPGGLALRVLSGLARAAAGLVQEIATTAVQGPAARSAARGGHPHTGTGRAQGGPRAGRLVDSAQDRAIAAKAHGAGGGFTVAVRYLSTTTPSGPTPAGPTSAAQAMASGAGCLPGRAGREGIRVAAAVSRRRTRAVGSAFAEFSGHNYFQRRRLHHPARAIERRRLRRGDTLSVPEVAALAHLPTDEHVPGLRRAGAAAVAPPPQVPATGAGVRPLGESDVLAGRPVGLSVPDARHHLWILGATGSGKSTLCVHGILADAAAGRAAIVLDPKGDLVTEITARLPASARARTIVIDPDRPGPGGWPCLNPLAPLASPCAAPEVVGDGAVENVVTVMSRVFASAWGHRSEDLLRVTCLTLRAHPDQAASLADIPALLTHPPTRKRAVAALDPAGRLGQFWAWFDQLPDSSRAQISAPLLNKLRAILLRPFAEGLLCRTSTVDLAELLDSGGLLLVRLPKGTLGEDTVRLVGSLIVAQVWQATLARAARPEHHRPDATLLLDECHNFLHLPYRLEDLLAEARGFRLSLTLAHQHLGQLTPALREGIATNARNKIFFAVSPEDAAALARHTLPELGPHDLANLDGFHAAALLITAGAPSRPFTLTTRPLPPVAGGLGLSSGDRHRRDSGLSPDRVRPARDRERRVPSPVVDRFDPRR